MQPPEPIDPNFRIELDSFEGPLDLLLFLIQKHELEILDLPVAFVTERYLAYIDTMKRLNLDIASEYLVMAATLAHIKSKLLLPSPPSDQDDEVLEEGDPREELIRRLLEYQKYKLASEELEGRGVAGRDVFVRGIPGPQVDGPAPLAPTSLFKLLDAFQRVLARVEDDIALEISTERISIQERMTQVVDVLRERRQCVFDELFEGMVTRYDLVVTFLALLEMVKMRMLRIYQSDPKSPLHVQYRLLDAEDEAEQEDTALEIDSEAGHTSPQADAADSADSDPSR